MKFENVAYAGYKALAANNLLVSPRCTRYSLAIKFAVNDIK